MKIGKRDVALVFLGAVVAFIGVYLPPILYSFTGLEHVPVATLVAAWLIVVAIGLVLLSVLSKYLNKRNSDEWFARVQAKVGKNDTPEQVEAILQKVADEIEEEGYFTIPL